MCFVTNCGLNTALIKQYHPGEERPVSVARAYLDIESGWIGIPVQKGCAPSVMAGMKCKPKERVHNDKDKA